ncbi:reverse transcriptase domain-containing protein [Tanacetum coccineum]
MAGPEPITPFNEGTSNQNSKSIIEGHVSALKELLKEPNNRNLIKSMLLDFDDVQDVSDEEIEDGSKRKAKTADEDLSDPEDHIGRFVGIGNQGEWPMPVWCRMFQQTLDGKARAWFDKLSPGSIDNWGSLKEKFLNKFGMLKACDKDPTEISKIVSRANKTLPHFKESSHKCPELAKRFSDNVPKTVDEMLKRVDDYLRSEEAFRNTELPRGEFQRRDVQRNGAPERNILYIPRRLNQEVRRPRAVLTLDSLSSTPQEILATEHQQRLPQPAPLRQLELALESGKLNHLVKDVRQRGRGGQRNNGPPKAKIINMVQCHSSDRKRKTTVTDEKWMNVPIIFPPVLA